MTIGIGVVIVIFKSRWHWSTVCIWNALPVVM